MELPDPGDEEWRRTNLREMDFPPVRAATLDVQPHGATRQRFERLLRLRTRSVEKYLGTIVRADEWKFVALNSALWSGGQLVHVPKGSDAGEPVSITLSGLANGGAAFPRTLIVVEPQSHVQIIDDMLLGWGRVCQRRDGDHRRGRGEGGVLRHQPLG